MNQIVITLLLAVISLPALAAQTNVVDICHFDLDYGVWQLISISGNAVEAHFENHDDGLPDSDTLGTGTSLDSNCEVGTACPCFTQENLAALVVDGQLGCSDNEGSYTTIAENYVNRGDDGYVATANVYFDNKGAPPSCFYRNLESSNSVSNLTLDELNACRDALLVEMDNRGCTP